MGDIPKREPLILAIDSLLHACSGSRWARFSGRSGNLQDGLEAQRVDAMLRPENLDLFTCAKKEKEAKRKITATPRFSQH
jgi:hypothetical protein